MVKVFKSGKVHIFYTQESPSLSPSPMGANLLSTLKKATCCSLESKQKINYYSINEA